MEMRKAGIMVSAGLGGLFLAAALGCGGHVGRSAPWITGYQAGATSVQNGLTYQVATVGSTVLILGVNFDGTAAVSFGGRQAAQRGNSTRSSGTLGADSTKPGAAMVRASLFAGSMAPTVVVMTATRVFTSYRVSRSPPASAGFTWLSAQRRSASTGTRIDLPMRTLGSVPLAISS